jgi:hypothetical protein
MLAAMLAIGPRHYHHGYDYYYHHHYCYCYYCYCYYRCRYRFRHDHPVRHGCQRRSHDCGFPGVCHVARRGCSLLWMPMLPRRRLRYPGPCHDPDRDLSRRGRGRGRGLLLRLIGCSCRRRPPVCTRGLLSVIYLGLTGWKSGDGDSLDCVGIAREVLPHGRVRWILRPGCRALRCKVGSTSLRGGGGRGGIARQWRGESQRSDIPRVLRSA